MCCPQARVGEAKVHWGTICDSLPREENKREEGMRRLVGKERVTSTLLKCLALPNYDNFVG